MPSLFRKIKLEQGRTRPKDDQQPSRQSSRSSVPGIAGGEKMPGASLTSRFSRQLSLPGMPFRVGRKSSAISEPTDQNECRLLTSLPYELRELIYLEIVDTADWSVSIPRVSEDPKERRKEDRRRRKDKRKYGQLDGDMQYLLNLLQTCKSIRGEIQPLLFEKSHLHFPTLVTFGFFINSLPKERWKELRHVSLEATFPYLLFHEREGGPTEDEQDPKRMRYYNSETWTTVCERLRDMKRLKTLAISMHARDYRGMHSGWPARPSKKLWHTISEPLRQIYCSDDFLVEVSWSLDPEFQDEGGPFRVRTRIQDGQVEDEEGDRGGHESDTEGSDGEQI